MEFAKYHALGNDYAVLERAALPDPLSPDWLRRACDRHRGLGADGVLVREPGPGQRVSIFNPDGSEAEKSGNGLRIFARYLFERGAVGGERFAVETAGGTVHCEVKDGGRSVAVEMGPVHFEVLREPIEVAGVRLEFSGATLGNPHCVVLRERVSEAEARALGPLLERDPRFPRRTNVQFVEVLGPARLRVEVWERGAGYTLASGSSACAAAAVAHRLGLCGAQVEVVMPGGSLAIELSPAFEARMTGGVTKVAEGVLSPETFADVRKVPGQTPS